VRGGGGGGAAAAAALELEVSLAVERLEVLLEGDVVHAELSGERGELGGLARAPNVLGEAREDAALLRRQVAHTSSIKV
jgi:hypothetical protein